jgi:hypothetical protein
MAYLTKVSAPLHLGCKPLAGRIRRTVIDVDDLIRPATIERGSDLGNQRAYVLGFVAHGDNDGNCDPGCVRRRQINARFSWPGTGTALGPSRLASASYEAGAPRATLLSPSDDNPERGRIAPSRSMENPSRRAANQYCTNVAPITPIDAPATTSLG